jgi:hypothetical protein
MLSQQENPYRRRQYQWSYGNREGRIVSAKLTVQTPVNKDLQHLSTGFRKSAAN